MACVLRHSATSADSLEPASSLGFRFVLCADVDLCAITHFCQTSGKDRLANAHDGCLT